MNGLRALLDGYCDGTLDAAGAGELRRLLDDSAEARREYQYYMALRAELMWRSRGMAPARSRSGALARRVGSRAARLVVAACVVIGVGLLASMVFSHARRKAAPIEPVATLVDAQAAVIGEGGVAVAAGDPLRPGFLQIESGTAQIEFYSGARVTLTGPAEFGINAGTRGFLRRGRLLAHVPPAAHGFTVAAPGCAVIDLGTEFAMNVNERGVADVLVTAGRVRLLRGDERRDLPAGQAVRASVDRVEPIRASEILASWPGAVRLLGIDSAWTAAAGFDVSIAREADGLRAAFAPWAWLRHGFERRTLAIGDRLTLDVELRIEPGSAVDPNDEVRFGFYDSGAAGGAVDHGPCYGGVFSLPRRRLALFRRTGEVSPLAGSLGSGSRWLPGLADRAARLDDGAWHRIEVTLRRGDSGMEIAASLDGTPLGQAVDDEHAMMLTTFDQFGLGVGRSRMCMRFRELSLLYTPAAVPSSAAAKGDPR